MYKMILHFSVSKSKKSDFSSLGQSRYSEFQILLNNFSDSKKQGQKVVHKNVSFVTFNDR